MKWWLVKTWQRCLLPFIRSNWRPPIGLTLWCNLIPVRRNYFYWGEEIAGLKTPLFACAKTVCECSLAFLRNSVTLDAEDPISDEDWVVAVSEGPFGVADRPAKDADIGEALELVVGRGDSERGADGKQQAHKAIKNRWQMQRYINCKVIRKQK